MTDNNSIFADNTIERYIMIGNGFDLECGLPTSYRNYLDFLDGIHEYLQRGKSVRPEELKPFEKYIPNHKNNETLINAVINNPNISKIEYLKKWDFVSKNFWFYYFKNALYVKGWVDFENEISKVVRAIENNYNNHLKDEVDSDDEIVFSKNTKLYDIFEKATKYPSTYGSSKIIKKISHKYDPHLEWFTFAGSPYGNSNMTYSSFKDKLLKDLNWLIYGFELYLHDFVETIDVKPTKNIESLINYLSETSERYVLCFNYTTTFERMLEKADIDAEYCYVHGKVSETPDLNKCDLVLGIDEYLEPKKIQDNLTFASFRKYNQRIFKRTDSSYMDWLDDIRNGKSLEREMYIFGHSIGVTDKDIIRSFVLSNDMSTYIYYHNEESFSSQVANMTAIIGMDELIQRTGGKEHTIEFRKQD